MENQKRSEFDLKSRLAHYFFALARGCPLKKIGTQYIHAWVNEKTLQVFSIVRINLNRYVCNE